MRTDFILTIIIGLLFISCSAQSNRIENKIMDCSFQSFKDKGKEFKKIIKDYENLLIDEKILVDNSGKSYREVFQEIASGNGLDKFPSKNFANELQKIDKPINEKVQECRKLLIKDSLLYNSSKLVGLEQAILNIQNTGRITPSLIAKDILNVLSAEDFELDLYKVRTFFVFNLIEPDSGISRQELEKQESPTEYDMSKALEIFIDKSEIFINKDIVTIEELRSSVKDYELQKKSESVISLKSDRDTKYRDYIEVQNAIVEEIEKLREQLAIEKYKVDLKKLNVEQLSEIKGVYPQRIKENF